jgi:hypothetical protein
MLLRNRVLKSIAFAAAITCLPGCGGDEKSAPKAGGSPSAPVVKGGPWSMDSSLAADLKQDGSIGAYSFKLPSTLKPADLSKAKIPDNMQIATWSNLAGPEGPKVEDLSVTILKDDGKLSAEVKKNARQFLIDFSAGALRPQGINISQRSQLEEGKLAGIDFKRITFSGTSQGGGNVYGAAYVGLDDENAVMIIAFNQPQGGNGSFNRKLEAAVASLKKN